MTNVVHEKDWMVGDIVSRDGTDEHEIIAIAEGLVTVRCTKAPESGWTDVGDVEHNLACRYQFVTRPSN